MITPLIDLSGGFIQNFFEPIVERTLCINR